MIKVGHLDAAVNFMSLFSDTIRVKRIRLNDVTVLLEQNDQRVGNWVMGKPGDSLKAGKNGSEKVSVHRAPHLLCYRAFEVRPVRLHARCRASTAPCKRLQGSALQYIGHFNPVNRYQKKKR
jgi:hypothetical protein